MCFKSWHTAAQDLKVFIDNYLDCSKLHTQSVACLILYGWTDAHEQEPYSQHKVTLKIEEIQRRILPYLPFTFFWVEVNFG